MARRLLGPPGPGPQSGIRLRVANPLGRHVKTAALENQCLQRGLVECVTLEEVDGTNRLAVQARVEEPFRIAQFSALCWMMASICSEADASFTRIPFGGDL